MMMNDFLWKSKQIIFVHQNPLQDIFGGLYTMKKFLTNDQIQSALKQSFETIIKLKGEFQTGKKTENVSPLELSCLDD